MPSPSSLHRQGRHLRSAAGPLVCTGSALMADGASPAAICDPPPDLWHASPPLPPLSLPPPPLPRPDGSHLRHGASSDHRMAPQAVSPSQLARSPLPLLRRDVRAACAVPVIRTRTPRVGSTSNSAVFWRLPRRRIPRIKLEKLVKNSIRDSASHSCEPGCITFTVVACAVQGMGAPDIVGGIVCRYLSLPRGSPGPRRTCTAAWGQTASRDPWNRSIPDAHFQILTSYWRTSARTGAMPPRNSP